MTPLPRCPDKRFRTERYARRWAWGQHSDPTQRQVPVKCGDHWHLKAPDDAPAPHLPAQDAETDTRTGD